jgi:dihydrofolate reductase
MRKLKLQMQMSIDGFVAGPNGELDWMTWDWDKELEDYVDKLHNSIDTILLGRKMTDGFISHWSEITKKPSDPSYPFAKLMMETPKIVFSRTIKESKWENTIIADKDSVTFINELKKKPGENIIVYGGAGFVSSLVKDDLIDEYHLFINQTAIGKGMEIFKGAGDKKKFRLVQSRAFKCGIVENHYEPAKI